MFSILRKRTGTHFLGIVVITIEVATITDIADRSLAQFLIIQDAENLTFRANIFPASMLLYYHDFHHQIIYYI